MYTLAKEHEEIFYHQKDKLWSEQNICSVYETGGVCDKNISSEMIKFFDELYEESRTFWNLKLDCEFNSYEEFINRRLEEYLKSNGDDEELKKIKHAIIRQQSKVLCFEIGCARLNESSVKEYGSYVLFDKINYEFPGGYSTLVQYLANKLPTELIKLSHPVDTIAIEESTGELLIECNNGKTFRADHVIVTSSLNFLKKNYKKFLPVQLFNETKLTAIDSLKQGLEDKFF